MSTGITIGYMLCVIFIILISGAGTLHQNTAAKTVKDISNKKINDLQKHLRNSDATKKIDDHVTYSRLIVSNKVLRKALPSFEWGWLKNMMSDVLRSKTAEMSSDVRIGSDLEHHGRFTGGPCNCSGVICICCSYFNVFGFQNKTCTRLEYDPASENVNLNVKVKHPTETSDHYHATFHADRVKTKCVPIPIPYLETGMVDMCMGFYNVSRPAAGILNLCMVVNVRHQRKSVMTLFYDCMEMGHNLPPKPPGGDYDYPVVNKPGPDYYKFPSTSPSPPSREEPYDNEFYPKPKKKKGRQGLLNLTPSEVNGISSLISRLLVI